MPVRKQRTDFPKIGTKLVGRSRGQIVEAVVVAVRPDVGRVVVEMNGRRYNTLSAAAKAAVGNETNGWRFWGLD